MKKEHQEDYLNAYLTHTYGEQYLRRLTNNFGYWVLHKTEILEGVAVWHSPTLLTTIPKKNVFTIMNMYVYIAFGKKVTKKEKKKARKDLLKLLNRIDHG